MSVTSNETHDLPVIHSVSRHTYQAIAAALGEACANLKYDCHALIVPRLVSGLQPKQYEEFLKALGDTRLRHAYDGNILEISPRRDHDGVSRLLLRLVLEAADERGIDVEAIGATTLFKSGMEKGLEPDETFYIANLALVEGKDRFEPDVDPPPDLAIEIDVTHKLVSRMKLYATFGVPELWRYEKNRIVMYQLNGADYEPIERSISFPFLDGATLTRFAAMHGEMNQSKIARAFTQWLREQNS